MVQPIVNLRDTAQTHTNGAPGFLLRARCHYCSDFFSRADLVLIGMGILMCHKCYEKHDKALDTFMDNVLPECGECHTTPESDAKGNFQMIVHWKDGAYQILCKPCSAVYERKRLDLYADTPYGHIKKLKGAK